MSLLDSFFWSGDPNLRHSTRGFGELYHFEIVLVLAGLVLLLQQRERRDWPLIAGLVLYPIPAALTMETHALWEICGTVFFPVESAIGLCGLFGLIRSLRIYRAVCVLAVFVVGGSLLGYCKDYFQEYPRYGARAWVYGIEEAVRIAAGSSYPCVMVSDRSFFFPFYIYVLFYTEVPPGEYQDLSSSAKEKLWQYTEPLLGKYYTVPMEEFGLRRGSCLLMIRPDQYAPLAAASY